MSTIANRQICAHQYESANEYFNQPISDADINDMREVMYALVPKCEHFSKTCLIALICIIASFVVSLLVVNLNETSLVRESFYTKWFVIAHIITAVLIGVIWSSGSDIFIPPEKELSIKIGGVDYLRIPSMQGGMINQLEPTKDTRLDEWKNIPRVARFIKLLNGRQILNFEKQLITNCLLT